MTSPDEQAILADVGERFDFGFGFAPLQQYLVATERGRLQVLPRAWDARPAADGGQRWFDPNPSFAQAWRAPAFNWNHACAECHSTGVHKGYDAGRDAFATTFTELDVSCEACHGPGSNHVRWAETDHEVVLPHRGFEFELRGAELGAWRLMPGQATASREAEAPAASELDVCARCHSRRSQIHEAPQRGASLLDTHVPALLEPPLYFDDGQIREEVYEYGSFLQSKMHGAGVTCSDCHEPHSLELRAPGNALCARCHAPERFDTPAHHHHESSGRGASCVDCHMPARMYMQVDLRRDHSIRVPRPDLSASLSLRAPNACEACHPNVGASELARQLSAWGGTPNRHYGEVLARARAGDSSIADELVDLVLEPNTALMVRATAASLLGSITPSGKSSQGEALAVALGHEHPLVRLGALAALEGAPASIRWAAASALLSDPVRAVRFAAVRLLADVSVELTRSEQEHLERAVAEYLASFELNADRAEAHVERGNLLVDLGHLDDAGLAYARAVALDPGFSPAYVNWCDLLRRRGNEAGCAAALGEGLKRAPESPELHYALALSLIRRGNHAEAISALRTAVGLAPEIATYAYALVLALREAGEREEAAAVLASARARHPHDHDLRTLELSTTQLPSRRVRGVNYSEKLDLVFVETRRVLMRDAALNFVAPARRSGDSASTELCQRGRTTRDRHAGH